MSIRRWRIGVLSGVPMAVAALFASVPGHADETVEILFLGDTAFGEPYHDKLASEGFEPVLRTKGYDHMIESFAPMLHEADFVIANLETPITDAFPSPFAGRKNYPHYADPEKTPQILAKYGIDLVSLANNHAYDFGDRGLVQTLDTLGAQGIDTCGAGLTEKAAAAPILRNFRVGGKDVQVAVFCVFEFRRKYHREFGYYADGEKPGVAGIAADRIRRQIQAIRADNSRTVAIAFPHWGKNYVPATEDQREIAADLVQAGIDLVIGHGAHVMQEVESIDGVPVVYGIGNFVFGSPGRYGKKNVAPFSAVARLLLRNEQDKLEVELKLVPLITDNLVTGYRSRFASIHDCRAYEPLIHGIVAAFCADADSSGTLIFPVH